MTTSTIHEISEFRISPRRVLRPGMTFRTILGSEPTLNGQAVTKHGEFRCIRLYPAGRGDCRLYCVAHNLRTGTTHDVYLEGRPFTSATGIRHKPFRIKLM